MTRSLGSLRHVYISNLLARLRKEAGMTQVQVATRLRRPQSFVASVERGERRVDLAEFLYFAAAIGFDPMAAVAEIMKTMG